LSGFRAADTLPRVMEELINLVVQRTGLSHDDAQKVVEVVIDALKNRLPVPLAAELSTFLASGTSGGIASLETGAENAAKAELGGLLGQL
jgi:uncharacterized protein (DUF2267 family)